MKRITILLADDNTLVRREIRQILELEDDLEVVGEAKNGHQAVALVKKLRSALVLMDIVMPRLNGLQATRQILKAAPATKVLMLSVHGDEGYVEEAAKSGAMGYRATSRFFLRLKGSTTSLPFGSHQKTRSRPASA